MWTFILFCLLELMGYDFTRTKHDEFSLKFIWNTVVCVVTSLYVKLFVCREHIKNEVSRSQENDNNIDVPAKQKIA